MCRQVPIRNSPRRRLPPPAALYVDGFATIDITRTEFRDSLILVNDSASNGLTAHGGSFAVFLQFVAAALLSIVYVDPG